MDSFLLPPTANVITNDQNRSLLNNQTSTFLLEVCGKMPTTSIGESINNKENRPFFVQNTLKKRQTSLKLYFKS